MHVIQQHACPECLLPSVAQIAANATAGRADVVRAGDAALEQIRRIVDGEDEDGGD